MLFDDYLRDQAVMYRALAEHAADELARKEMLELAEICDEVANAAEDRETAG